MDFQTLAAAIAIAKAGGGGGGESTRWGRITGRLSDQTDLQQALDSKADIIKASASGSVVSISDGAPYAVDALSVGVDAVQDLHGYDAPFPEGARNKLNLATDATTIVDMTIVSEGETIKLTGTSGSPGYGWLALKNTVTLPVGTYKVGYQVDKRAGLSGIAMGTSNTLIGDTNISNISATGFWSQSFTLAEETTIARLRVTVSTGNTANEEFRVIISSDAVTSWFPYSNICPISGHTETTVTRTGKNLFDRSASNIKLVDIYYSDVYNSRYGYEINLPAGTYTLTPYKINPEISGTYLYGGVYKKDGTYVSTNNLIVGSNYYTQTITIGEDEKLMYCKAVGTLYDEAVDYFQNQINFSIALGTESAPLEYTGTYVTIALGSTVYGGVLDVKAGTLTVTYKDITFDGSEDEYFVSLTSSNGVRVAIDLPSDSMVWSNGNAKSGKLFSNEFPEGTNSQTTTGTNVIHYRSNSSHSLVVGMSGLIPATGSVVTNARAWFGQNPLHVVYALAEPETITGLTPATIQTLLGSNVVWADTGDIINLTYRADTKLYIEKLTRPTEDDMIANDDIESGKFFMVGNNLYYSTAAISEGTTIVPETNCTQLSLADALNNLNQ